MAVPIATGPSVCHLPRPGLRFLPHDGRGGGTAKQVEAPVKFFSSLSIAALLAGTLATGTALAARPLPQTITLPGASSAEGIARGAGTTFYAGELNSGDIFRGDLRTGVVTRWLDAPAGRQALGLRVDLEHGLLFVAGGFTGQGYVYDLSTGATIASFQFGTPPGSIINDVIVAGGAAVVHRLGPGASVSGPDQRGRLGR